MTSPETPSRLRLRLFLGEVLEKLLSHYYIPPRQGKLRRLPDRGRLIVGADLHGNFEDSKALTACFIDALLSTGNAYMLLLGDVIHGVLKPKLDGQGKALRDEAGALSLEQVYPDQSEAVLDFLIDLRALLGDRIIMLLGDHEHAHIGGPRIIKYNRDPAAAFMQRNIDNPKLARYLQLFRELPLAAKTQRGIVFSHSGPIKQGLIKELDELEKIDYELKERDMVAWTKNTAFGNLLWNREYNFADARAYLAAMSSDGILARMAVYGHTAKLGNQAGYFTPTRDQLVLVTTESAGRKCFLELDLEARLRSVYDLEARGFIRELGQAELPAAQLARQSLAELAKKRQRYYFRFYRAA